MTAADYADQLKDLDATLRSIEAVLDVDRLRQDKVKLEEAASAPDLWDDQVKAQEVTSQLSYVNSEIERLGSLRSRLDDAYVLLELAEAEDDPGVLGEVETEIGGLGKAIQEMEVRTLLSGEYDSRQALVAIRAGAGGVDAADFAEMLLRMYLRWAERHGYPTEVYETSYAEEAGLKSATFAVKFPYAYGTLSVESGTHRLVRISPFDNQGRRQTSFAGVEVLPVTEQTDHIDIAENEIRVDVYRSSGPGGQSVNTTDSAVRITHIPTGIVVTCQNEKSQLQNKASAMRVLQSRLLERKRQEEQARLAGLKTDAAGSWGDQMRSYVLHPYQMVKDLRTEQETGNPTAVFDGEAGWLHRGGNPLAQAASARWRGGLSDGPPGRTQRRRRATPFRHCGPIDGPWGLDFSLHRVDSRPVIQLEQVTKTYPKASRPSLDDVSVSIEKGEFVFFIGPSGSGKSTIIKLLLHEVTPSKGKVVVNSRDVTGMRSWKIPNFRRSIGCVFQDFRLLPNRTAYENVAFALEVIGKTKAVARRVVPEVLELVGLGGKEHRYPHELSGGEQQRVAVARAFVNRPLILLADEPTGNLDPDTSIEIMRLLDRINRTGTTVVMVTHDSNIVNQMRRRVIEIESGRIVRDQARGVYG